MSGILRQILLIKHYAPKNVEYNKSVKKWLKCKEVTSFSERGLKSLIHSVWQNIGVKTDAWNICDDDSDEKEDGFSPIVTEHEGGDEK